MRWPGTTVALGAGARLAALAALATATGCGGAIGTGDSLPVQTASRQVVAGSSAFAQTTFDASTAGGCSLSADGVLFYAVPAGAFAPIDAGFARCTAPASLERRTVPPIPSWAQRTAGTQTIFVATSLEETYAPDGMFGIERDAEAAGVPVSWMIGNGTYLDANADFYNRTHAANGDDVELENQTGLYTRAAAALPWYAPAVSVEGAGRERNVPALRARGNDAFWGITWNSHMTDRTSDAGAPWGTYCADPGSYKRPSPSGDCTLLAFEWAARDLTRAYLSDTTAFGYSAEAAYSTIPQDVLMRGGFDAAGGAAYVRALVDAYASAGVSQPIVMTSEFEPVDESARGTAGDVVLAALYGRAVGDGMRPMTLRQAAAAARPISAAPRAIAFPFVPGGTAMVRFGAPFMPATIDYHDGAAGLTFLAGHAAPDRIVPYAAATTSAFDVPLRTLEAGALPQVVRAVVGDGSIAFHLSARVATHAGVAVWSDPYALRVDPATATYAGHGGFVSAYDVPAGESDRVVRCGGCRAGAPLAYST